MNKHIITITGPSGSGKTELVKLLTQRHNFSKLVSVTTRPRRHGEVEGLDYYFISEERYRALKAEDQLIQSVDFNWRHYGTTREELQRIYSMGRVPVVIVEPSGITQFRRVALDEGLQLKTVLICADYEKLIERFLNRVVADGGVGLPYHAKRIAAIHKELDWSGSWPYDLRLDNSSDNLDILMNYAQVIGEKYGSESGDGQER